MANPPVLYFPYEAQPEQNAIAQIWRNGGGQTVGYLHGTMLTFPGHYIRPNIGEVDVLWVHGSAYPPILRKIGWLSNDIKVIKSLRFSKQRLPDALPRAGDLYLPYWSGSMDFAMNQIKNASAEGKLLIGKLKPHPATGLSNKARKIFESMVQTRYECAADRASAQLISIGPISVPIEELERGTPHDIIHVPLSTGSWDSFATDLWQPYLDVTQISPNAHAFMITLKKPGSFILFEGQP